jgi:hypothetical protein
MRKRFELQDENERAARQEARNKLKKDGKLKKLNEEQKGEEGA